VCDCVIHLPPPLSVDWGDEFARTQTHTHTLTQPPPHPPLLPRLPRLRPEANVEAPEPGFLILTTHSALHRFSEHSLTHSLLFGEILLTLSHSRLLSHNSLIFMWILLTLSNSRTLSHNILLLMEILLTLSHSRLLSHNSFCFRQIF
jgi:hypothetical protein